MKLTQQNIIIIGALLALTYVVLRGWKGAAADVAGAAVDVGVGAVTGASVAAGQIVGIPATDTSQCELACAAGDTLHASMYCSASRFGSYLWNGK